MVTLSGFSSGASDLSISMKNTVTVSLGKAWLRVTETKFNLGCLILAGGCWRHLALASGKTSRWTAFLGVSLQSNVD